MTLLRYIRRKNLISESSMDFYTPAGIHVYFKDPMENEDIDMERCIAKVESALSSHLIREVEMIIVGHFDELEERSLSAFYDGGTLYVSPEQESEEDTFNDIVHEIAHSLEEPHGSLIYHDSKIEKEFLNKRRSLHKILWQLGFKTPEAAFTDTEYNEDFDMFLYETVGYDKLALLTQGIFISPYAATSLREYFATGFSEYYADSNHNYLKTVSPQLYKKILLLQDEEELDNSF